MKTALVILLVTVSTTAFAQLEKSPFDTFDGTKKMTGTSTITWKTVPNVQEVCSKESQRRGKGKFGYAIDACAFWDQTPKGHVCTIITKPKPNYWDLGHEVRHCFQGNWH
jgi:hypothetical protein